MNDCEHSGSDLVALLEDELAPDRRRRLVERLETCASCAEELRTLRRTWGELPAAPADRAPAEEREWVLAHARDAAAAPESVMAELWQTARPAVLSAAAGGMTTTAVVGALHFSSGLAVRQHIAVLVLGLALAALLSGVVGGLWTAVSRRATRAVLLGGLGSLGGYLVLSILHPIPSAVEFCQVQIFRDPAMSLGEICLVYAAVAALYAGVPVGVTAYLSSAGGDDWKVGLAEAAVFTLLALPVLGLQFGLENVAITGTVLAGVVLGAVAGGVAGVRVRVFRRAFGAGG